MSGITDEERDFWHTAARNLIDRQSGRLREAAGIGDDADEATRRALRDVAHNCHPDTIDALVALLSAGRADGELARSLVSWWDSLTPEERALTGVEAPADADA